MMFRGVWQGRRMETVPRDLAPLLSGVHRPQKAFSFPRERWGGWLAQLHGIGPVLDSLPPALDRGTTAGFVEDLLPETWRVRSRSR